ncbi:MAG TPA: flagellar biosynthesis anti-sigma factor FlgM [Anaerolineaceae bacterium]|nr:flagellar biosynthesis anti-sigma factor FlgM [Anaerolineaceae bacterium]
MKVENNGINPLLPQKSDGPKSATKHTRLEEPAGEMKTDKAELSEQARLLSKAHQVFNDTPDVREDKVNAIKVQVESGNYHIPLNELARRLYKKVV